MKALIFLVLTCATLAAFSQPGIVKDINNEAASGTANSGSSQAQILFNNRLYFPAFTPGTGQEIFYSDGTKEGTGILKDIFPGDRGIQLYGMGVVGNSLFIGLSGADGPALWKSDGTAEGTVQVTLVTALARTQLYTVANGVIYFTGQDADHGSEVWRSDGTAEGTYLLKDIRPGSDPSVSAVHWFGQLGNQVLFVANDGVNGNEVWKTDGTAAGTTMLKNINPSGDGIFHTEFTRFGDYIYFTADDGVHGIEVWKTDGTQAGTTMISDADGSFSFDYFFPVGDKLLIRHNNNTERSELYVVDTNTDNVSLLKDIFPGAESSVENYHPSAWALHNGKVYFIARDATGTGVWVTDGTTAGTIPAPSLNLGPAHSPFHIRSSGGILYVLSSTGNGETLLLKGDGVNAFTTILDTKFIFYPVALNDKLFMYVYDDLLGEEPWISDGTEAGTFLLKDLNTQSPSGPVDMVTLGDKVVFINQDQNKYQVWVTDGSEASTTMLEEFESGSVSNLTVIGNKAYFYAYTNAEGIEPWVTDGTDAGTFLLKDVVPGSGSAVDGNTRFYQIGNAAYFISSSEIWKTDGTSAGTVLAATIQGPFYQIQYPVVFQNNLYFLRGQVLWKSDGTPGGTSEVKDLRSQPTGSFSAFALMAGASKMFLAVDDGVHGMEVWTSDGTEAGTRMIKDIHPSSVGFYISYPQVVHNDIAYFYASETSDLELWRSDGTEAGTYLIKDINPGSTGSTPQFQKVVGNAIYFTADDGVHGRELWKTDGTAAGTVLVKDISPGKYSSDLNYSYVHDGRLFFQANDGVHGNELWKTSGTEASTVLIADINPGSLSTFISGFTLYASLGKKLFFKAQTADKGMELWVYDSAPQPQTITFEPVTGKKFNDAPVALVASASSGLPLTYSLVSGPGILNGNTLTITGAGEIKVKASQAGNDNYLAASVDRTITIGKADQVIDDIYLIVTLTPGRNGGTLGAEASSGLPVRFSIVSYSGAQGVSISQAGDLDVRGPMGVTAEVIVRATQEGNENYNPASKDKTFVFNLVSGLEPQIPGFDIYPNPAVSTIVVSLPSSPSFKALALSDMLGRNVISMDVTQQEIVLDVEKFPRGIYIVRLTGDKKFVYTKKVILK